MMKFNNVNPSLLLKEFNEAGIKINIINSNLKIGETVATESWCDIPKDADENLINGIVANHNPNKIEEKKPTNEQILISQLMQQNAEMQLQQEEQKRLNADLLLKIAMLGGSTNV